MKAVFSFWSKRFKETGRIHSTVENPVFFNSWILSVKLAKRFFPKVTLYTDDYGKELLVNQLGLQFDEVDLRLNDLESIPSYLWAYGKVISYQAQTEPFLHIDYDAFFYAGLGKYFNGSPVIVESKELFSAYHFYDPLLNFLFQKKYYSSTINAFKKLDYAYNCGVFGGYDLDFIKFYCKEALAIADFMSANDFDKIQMPQFASIIFEQSALASCLSYVNIKPALIVHDNGTFAIPYTHLKGDKSLPGMNDKILSKTKSLFKTLNIE